MSDYSDMYSYEEFEVPKMPPTESTLKTPINKGYVTELEINGKKIELINPEYIRGLHTTIDQMTTNLKRADRAINTLNSTVRKLNQDVKDLRSKMDRKIDSI